MGGPLLLSVAGVPPPLRSSERTVALPSFEVQLSFVRSCLLLARVGVRRVLVCVPVGP